MYYKKYKILEVKGKLALCHSNYNRYDNVETYSPITASQFLTDFKIDSLKKEYAIDSSLSLVIEYLTQYGNKIKDKYERIDFNNDIMKHRHALYEDDVHFFTIIRLRSFFMSLRASKVSLNFKAV